MRWYSVLSPTVDWDAVRRDTLAAVRDAHTLEHAYPVIRAALVRTGDPHAVFYDPEQVRRLDAGAFVVPSEGYRFPFAYRDGQVIANGGALARLDGEPYALRRQTPPVAILTDPLTASAAEMVAIAFRGRPDARSFGTPTAGVPTNVSADYLPDGAMLAISTYYTPDRAGTVYTSRIAPDEAVASDWRWFGTDRDPVLSAARDWLMRQPACVAGG